MTHQTHERPAVPLCLAILSCLALPALAGETAPDFDRGADVPALVGEIKEAARASRGLGRADYGPAYDRTERDCADISFRKDDPLISESVLLESREYQERCYPGGPNGERNCHEEWVRTERRRVRVEVSGRGGMLPWERDVFEVCLDGYWLSARVVDASHAYQLEVPGWSGDIIQARATRKTPSLPDPAGILAESFRYDAGSSNFDLTLRDRWASYYQGERTVLTVKLVRYHKNWFDDTVLEKELALPASDSYAIRFADYASEIGSALKPGKQYYAKFRFKRAGAVSKDKWTRFVDTNKAEFGAASGPLVANATSFEATALKACFFEDIRKDQCVYRCRDGSLHRTPVRQPGPFDRDRDTLPCPQLVFPF